MNICIHTLILIDVLDQLLLLKPGFHQKDYDVDSLSLMRCLIWDFGSVLYVFGMN